MSEETFFEIKKPFTARLTSEGHQLFQESLIDIVPDKEAKDLNNRIILDRLIELAISKGRKIFVQRPEDTAAIQNLTNEIGRLKIEHDFLKDENSRLESMYTDTNRTALVLQDEVRQLQAAPVIGENDVLVQLSPLFKLVLKLEAASLKKKTGKDYTAQDILIEAYKEIGITGGRNIPFRQWSVADYKKAELILNNPVAQ